MKSNSIKSLNAGNSRVKLLESNKSLMVLVFSFNVLHLSVKYFKDIETV